MEQNIIAVSQVNEYIKFLLDRDELLGNICVRGELSNYKVYPSGHHYFTLKDAEGALRCVMFRSSAQRLRFRPENGMQVIASGRVTVFPRDGAYQLYCNTLTADGAGDLYVAFEQLKEKLAKEGLFDPAHKKPIPKYPHTIAIITSAAGAAIMDMLRILGKRYPLTKVKLLPVRVQGAEAPAEIAGAIRYANRYQVADLIITGRGGGSMEDLWTFNEESVVRAVAMCKKPVVSAVGHETDVTLCDLAADLRVPTPSAAAECVTPIWDDVAASVEAMRESLKESAEACVEARRNALILAQTKLNANRPDLRVARQAERLEAQTQTLLRAMREQMQKRQGALDARQAALELLSPYAALKRGYAIVQKEGGAVAKAALLRAGDEVSIRFADGVIRARVWSEEEEHGQKADV